MAQAIISKTLIEMEPRREKFPFPVFKGVDSRMSGGTMEEVTRGLSSMLGNEKTVIARVAAD